MHCSAKFGERESSRLDSLHGKNDARERAYGGVTFSISPERAEPIIFDDRLKREWLRLHSDCLPTANDRLGLGREGIGRRETALDFNPREEYLYNLQEHF